MSPASQPRPPVSPPWVWSDLKRSRSAHQALAAYLLNRIRNGPWSHVIWLGSTVRKDPFPGHPEGRAGDWMTTPVSRPYITGNKAAGDWLMEVAIDLHNRGAIQLHSVIHFHRQWKPGRGFYRRAAADHNNHVHIEIANGATWRPDRLTAGIPLPGGSADPIGDDDMSLTDDDVMRVAKAVWTRVTWRGDKGDENAGERLGTTYALTKRMPTDIWAAQFGGPDETAGKRLGLAALSYRSVEMIAGLQGQVQAMENAITQISQGGKLNLMEVQEAARKGVSDALAQLRADVTLVIKPDEVGGQG